MNNPTWHWRHWGHCILPSLILLRKKLFARALLPATAQMTSQLHPHRTILRLFDKDEYCFLNKYKNSVSSLVSSFWVILSLSSPYIFPQIMWLSESAFCFPWQPLDLIQFEDCDLWLLFTILTQLREHLAISLLPTGRVSGEGWGGGAGMEGGGRETNFHIKLWYMDNWEV